MRAAASPVEAIGEGVRIRMLTILVLAALALFFPPHRALGQSGSKRALYKFAIEVAPKFAAELAFGAVDMMVGKHATASSNNQTSAQLARAQLIRGLKFFNEEKYSEAFDAISQSARLGNTKALTLLGVFYEYGIGNIQSDISKAITALQQAAVNNESLAALELANIYIFKRSPSSPNEVDNILLQAILANDLSVIDQARAYYFRGIVRYNRQNYRDAATDLSDAIRLNPGVAVYYNARGNAFLYTGLYQEAETDYRQAKQLDSSVSAYPYNLGLVYINMGRNDDAINSLTEARNLGFKPEDVSRQLEIACSRPHNPMLGVAHCPITKRMFDRNFRIRKLTPLEFDRNIFDVEGIHRPTDSQFLVPK